MVVSGSAAANASRVKGKQKREREAAAAAAAAAAAGPAGRVALRRPSDEERSGGSSSQRGGRKGLKRSEAISRKIGGDSNPLSVTGQAGKKTGDSDRKTFGGASGESGATSESTMVGGDGKGAGTGGLRPAVDPNGRDAEETPKSEETGWRGTFQKLEGYRETVGQLVNNERVQVGIVILIAVNAIMMGIGTFDFVTEDPPVELIFERIDLVFLLIFTIELGMQLFYHGFMLFTDGWLIFDFVIIATSWAFSETQIIRAFRIFRALRLITRIKVMKNLVLALLSVLPRMVAITLLMLLIFYIFAVMFTQLFKDMYHQGQTEEDYFSRLDSTFFTLFQMMTLDAWADVARDVMATHTWAWLPFISFVVISGFIVVNLIIAVICDAVSALHDDEKAHLQGRASDDEEEEHYRPTAHDILLPANPHSQRYLSAREVEEEQEEDEEQEDEDDLKRHHEDVDDNAFQSEDVIDMQDQIRELEDQVAELVRIQERTMHTLEYLTRHIQLAKLKSTPSSPPAAPDDTKAS